MRKLLFICFGGAGFFGVSIFNVLKTNDLFFAFKQGIGGFIFFGILGYLVGAVLSQILRDNTSKQG